MLLVTAVCFESKSPPDGLIGGDVSSSEINLDPVNVSVTIHCACGQVSALVDVLADILDGLDGAAQLHIDVGLEYLTEHLVMRNHPFIVD